MEDELSLSKRALPEISHNFNQESVEGGEEMLGVHINKVSIDGERGFGQRTKILKEVVGISCCI